MQVRPRLAVDNHSSPFNGHHNLEATIFGVICTKCVTKVGKRGNGLLPPSLKAIRSHWVKCGCYIRKPNSHEAEVSLEMDLNNIGLSVPRDPMSVAIIAGEHFPNNSQEKDTFVCKNCLFQAFNYTDFGKHFGLRNTLKCRQPNPKPSCHQVDVGKYGIALPMEMLNCITHGTFFWMEDDWMLRWPPNSELEEEV